ncbi:hypothetical protein J7384_04890 [Endozoicomonas sp. G2_1]|uniref:hypothetical protein n=1 Tax=Endozoicomonas sp. G2_1 TaxID=2821091 RepID=UPI001ADA4DEA|nr:hypothetical protein [Endozoicomonas sp. G2_1]MBO9489696.1 hypothetical protein [Endozoicomonas sp. G2_1]
MKCHLLAKSCIHLVLTIALISLCVTSADTFAQNQQKPEIAAAASKLEQDHVDDLLGWGDWQQGVLAIDLSTLPLTPKQRSILADKIAQLKADFGVGVSGEIEQAISELDASNLVNDSTGKKRSNRSEDSPMNSKFHDDLLLEEEILALEFANAKPFDDPEGLGTENKTNKLLFDTIFARLLQLEQQQLQALDEKIER